jgi:hypothetical protein
MDGPFFITQGDRFLRSGESRLGPSLDIVTGSWATQDRIFGDDIFEASPISDALPGFKGYGADTEVPCSLDFAYGQIGNSDPKGGGNKSVRF